MNATEPLQLPNVEKFREIVLWPVQLLPRHEGTQIQNHWECLSATSTDSVWNEVADEFSVDPAEFKERHYKEFVTFLPFVQRFLYGEGGGSDGDGRFGRSPIHVFRRNDVAQARITLPDDPLPATFNVAHVDLYFFYDIDIAILVMEIIGEKLSLRRALDTLYRFGRAYPTHWERSGRGGHCAERVEWLSHSGAVLAVSDYENKARYLRFVGEHRAPCVASHWEFLMEPLVLDHSQREGDVRYREIEYQRMPLMSYLALDEKTRLTRGDLVRFGLVTRPGDARTLPFSEQFLEDFERRYCYDRYWEEAREHDFSDMRLLSNGHDFTMIGETGEPFFTDTESGMLGQFRHQYFLLFLITHFHKAALLILSNRLVAEISRLDIRRPDSVRAFRRDVKHVTEIFLRFTNRYWFHEVSDQAQARDVFTMMRNHLGTDELYRRTRLRILDMNDYLERDQVRRQTDSMVRLTVVTTFGLIGTVTTGFLGMNLIAAADNTFSTKLIYFMLILIPIIALTVYTVVKSKRLAEFLETLSDERLTKRDKLNTLFTIWKKERRASRQA
ncbi:hypothetical protein C8R32_12017 [Nitrosospira sp. Nsp5]|uniref:CorA-like Mg2+ transporter protein n=1 Tax=Nitrosospira multiformis TaxID=1231 RepID=A0ABY0TD56_9PROT|nr:MULTISPECIES: hypothetical protein [Nitrosospira]PTR05507.1 hypothetical protein C8R32_12017 [Nitrosospira sp. Nsp5]SDQ61857.1 hypothetical protein SAMN05216402_1571 [Nitrosospira multiformis]